MFVKRMRIVLTVFVITFLSVIVSCAEESVALSQVCVWEQNIDVYISGDMNLDNLSCKVSNQTARIVESGSLADRRVTVRTTILVDVSMSMPLEVREDIIHYIDTLIKNINENEQYKIAVFGEQLNVLQDFTSDRYDLSNAANQIVFDGQQSIIYDAIYNTLPQIQPLDNAPCYYRTILITDGIDDTVSGITKEELYLELRTDTYPVDVVAVSKSKQTEPNKDLSAFTRISGGKYINLYHDFDLNELLSALSINDIFWLRVVVPGALLDGSTRQIDISDGTVSLQFDVKVPVFDIQEIEISTLAETPNTEVYNEVEESEIKTSDTEETLAQADTNLQTRQLIMIYMCAGIGVASMITLIIVLSVMRNLKKKQKNVSSREEENADFEDMTSDDATVMITDDDFHVNLHSTDNPSKGWNLSLSENIIIGRDTNCQVCLTDKSVSRLQCKLYLDKGIPLVENMSKSNVTRINGEAVSGPHMIREGDKLECGRVVLLIGLIYTSHLGDADKLNKMTEYVNL